MSNFTYFHLDCTRWYRFTLLNHGKKSQCCWRGTYMRRVMAWQCCHFLLDSYRR